MGETDDALFDDADVGVPPGSGYTIPEEDLPDYLRNREGSESGGNS